MTERTVYTSRGARAFHRERTCRARWAGRDLNDWNVDGKGAMWVPGCRALNLYAVEPMTVPAAMGAGTMPCNTCFPGWAAAWFRSPSEDDFGHVPVGFCGVWYCGRCDERRRDHRGREVYRPIPWPCTSALVLGLVPREVTP